ncbi:MAG TPA: AsmA family protein [Candidatus Acidoferrales bacterium]|nr:AsmA family protein [Candidatus Acidoferrales bacterium]
MKKFLKIIGIIVVVLILIAIALPFVINVNKFKPTLETELTTALGRKVQIGNIELSILSGGVKVSDVSIADDPVFSQSPFLQAKEVTAGVALLPLIFSGKLAVSSFTVTDPQVQLLHAASGKWNFSSLGGSASKAPTKGGSSTTNISVEKLTISNATVNVGTAGARGKTQTYSGIDIEASDLSFTSQFPFKVSMKTPGGGTISVDGKAGPVNATDASLTPLDAKVGVKNLDLAKTGFVDPATGIAGIVDFTGDLSSDGHQMKSKGTVGVNKAKLVANGSPASVPVNVDYATAYELASQKGNLTQGDIHIGKALAHLTGAYNISGATAAIQMKMNGQGMPVADLEGVLPAVGVALPTGAKLESGSLDLALAISGPVDKLVITGPVNLANGKVAGFSLSSKLGALGSFAGLGGKGGSDTEIQKLSADLRQDPSGTQANNLVVVVPSIGTVTGTANVSASGQLDCKMNAKLAGGLGTVTSAMTSFGGKGAQSNGIPFKITGTTSNPIFLPDVTGMAGSMAKGLAGGATGTAGGAAGAATSALGGLFGKKKSN